MKKFITKVALSGVLVLSGLSMTGCTDFQNGLVTGTAVGVAGTMIAKESSNSNNSKSYYDAGYDNGCSSANGRWYKSKSRWRNYASYRNGWRNGYKRCR
jgi:hypothetical protein